MSTITIIVLIGCWILIGILPVTYLTFGYQEESKKFRQKVGRNAIIKFFLLGGIFGLITFITWVLFQFFVYNKEQ